LSLKIRYAMIVAISLAWLYTNSALASGGDGFSENEFAPEYHVTAEDLPAYASGQLGVIPPSYWRIYLTLAYRALIGKPVSGADVQLLKVDGWRVGETSGWAWEGEDAKGVPAWLAARRSVDGAAEVSITVWKNASDYSNYPNCQTDAFDRAAATLAARLQQGGQKWASVWLAGQDAVFSNCSEGSRPAAAMPAPLPEDAPTWLQKDAAYQKAAALFYAQHFDEARADFQVIAQDTTSPWQPIAPYLAARCLIRKATLQEIPNAMRAKRNGSINDNESLKQARAELLALKDTYPPANRLVNWIDAQSRPQARLGEIEASLFTKTPMDADGVREVQDYLRVLDDTSEDPMIDTLPPMTAWIRVMQLSGDDPYLGDDHEKTETARQSAIVFARKNWAQTQATAWLLPLMLNAKAGELTPAESKAVNAITPASPAYQTLRYHLARLALESGAGEDADRIVNAMLTQQAGMSIATRNRWLGLKMLTAGTREDFVAAAARQPVREGRGMPIPNETEAPTPSSYDGDFTLHLYRDLPLSELVAVSKNQKMAELRSTLLPEVIWTRAVILDDFETADATIDGLSSVAKELPDLVERYKKAPDKDSKKLIATLILTESTFDPSLIGPDDIQMNWGCRAGWYGASLPQPLDRLKPRFQDKAALARNEAERERFKSLPRRSSFLAPTLLAWAKAKPDDPHAPLALHRLIASTRNECGGGEIAYPAGRAPSPTYSRDAFRLLHKLWPNNEWTLKTRYYY
jgi:hypothetical protein